MRRSGGSIQSALALSRQKIASSSSSLTVAVAPAPPQQTQSSLSIAGTHHHNKGHHLPSCAPLTAAPPASAAVAARTHLGRSSCNGTADGGVSVALRESHRSFRTEAVGLSSTVDTNASAPATHRSSNAATAAAPLPPASEEDPFPCNYQWSSALLSAAHQQLVPVLIRVFDRPSPLWRTVSAFERSLNRQQQHQQRGGDDYDYDDGDVGDDNTCAAAAAAAPWLTYYEGLDLRQRHSIANPIVIYIDASDARVKHLRDAGELLRGGHSSGDDADDDAARFSYTATSTPMGGPFTLDLYSPSEVAQRLIVRALVNGPVVRTAVPDETAEAIAAMRLRMHHHHNDHSAPQGHAEVGDDDAILADPSADAAPVELLRAVQGPEGSVWGVWFPTSLRELASPLPPPCGGDAADADADDGIMTNSAGVVGVDVLGCVTGACLMSACLEGERRLVGGHGRGPAAAVDHHDDSTKTSSNTATVAPIGRSDDSGALGQSSSSASAVGADADGGSVGAMVDDDDGTPQPSLAELYRWAGVEVGIDVQRGAEGISDRRCSSPSSPPSSPPTASSLSSPLSSPASSANIPHWLRDAQSLVEAVQFCERREISPPRFRHTCGANSYPMRLLNFEVGKDGATPYAPNLVSFTADAVREVMALLREPSVALEQFGLPTRPEQMMVPTASHHQPTSDGGSSSSHSGSGVRGFIITDGAESWEGKSLMARLGGLVAPPSSWPDSTSSSSSSAPPLLFDAVAISGMCDALLPAFTTFCSADPGVVGTAQVKLTAGPSAHVLEGRQRAARDALAGITILHAGLVRCQLRLEEADGWLREEAVVIDVMDGNGQQQHRQSAARHCLRRSTAAAELLFDTNASLLRDLTQGARLAMEALSAYHGERQASAPSGPLGGGGGPARPSSVIDARQRPIAHAKLGELYARDLLAFSAKYDVVGVVRRRLDCSHDADGATEGSPHREGGPRSGGDVLLNSSSLAWDATLSLQFLSALSHLAAFVGRGWGQLAEADHAIITHSVVCETTSAPDSSPSLLATAAHTAVLAVLDRHPLIPDNASSNTSSSAAAAAALEPFNVDSDGRLVNPPRPLIATGRGEGSVVSGAPPSAPPVATTMSPSTRAESAQWSTLGRPSNAIVRHGIEATHASPLLANLLAGGRGEKGTTTSSTSTRNTMKDHISNTEEGCASASVVSFESLCKALLSPNGPWDSRRMSLRFQSAKHLNVAFRTQQETRREVEEASLRASDSNLLSAAIGYGLDNETVYVGVLPNAQSSLAPSSPSMNTDADAASSGGVGGSAAAAAEPTRRCAASEEEKPLALRGAPSNSNNNKGPAASAGKNKKDVLGLARESAACYRRFLQNNIKQRLEMRNAVSAHSLDLSPRTAPVVETMALNVANDFFFAGGGMTDPLNTDAVLAVSTLASPWVPALRIVGTRRLLTGAGAVQNASAVVDLPSASSSPAGVATDTTCVTTTGAATTPSSAGMSGDTSASSSSSSSSSATSSDKSLVPSATPPTATATVAPSAALGRIEAARSRLYSNLAAARRFIYFQRILFQAGGALSYLDTVGRTPLFSTRYGVGRSNDLFGTTVPLAGAIVAASGRSALSVIILRRRRRVRKGTMRASSSSRSSSSRSPLYEAAAFMAAVRQSFSPVVIDIDGSRVTPQMVATLQSMRVDARTNLSALLHELASVGEGFAVDEEAEGGSGRGRGGLSSASPSLADGSKVGEGAIGSPSSASDVGIVAESTSILPKLQQKRKLSAGGLDVAGATLGDGDVAGGGDSSSSGALENEVARLKARALASLGMDLGEIKSVLAREQQQGHGAGGGRSVSIAHHSSSDRTAPSSSPSSSPQVADSMAAVHRSIPASVSNRLIKNQLSPEARSMHTHRLVNPEGALSTNIFDDSLDDGLGIAAVGALPPTSPVRTDTAMASSSAFDEGVGDGEIIMGAVAEEEGSSLDNSGSAIDPALLQGTNGASGDGVSVFDAMRTAEESEVAGEMGVVSLGRARILHMVGGGGGQRGAADRRLGDDAASLSGGRSARGAKERGDGSSSSSSSSAAAAVSASSPVTVFSNRSVLSSGPDPTDQLARLADIIDACAVTRPTATPSGTPLLPAAAAAAAAAVEGDLANRGSKRSSSAAARKKKNMSAVDDEGSITSSSPSTTSPSATGAVSSSSSSACASSVGDAPFRTTNPLRLSTSPITRASIAFVQVVDILMPTRHGEEDAPAAVISSKGKKAALKEAASKKNTKKKVAVVAAAAEDAVQHGGGEGADDDADAFEDVYEELAIVLKGAFLFPHIANTPEVLWAHMQL